MASPVVGELIGSSGTLIAAALESVGYYYQAYVLDNLKSPLTGSVAMLIYIAAAVIAIARYALTGKADNAIWFLLGPAMFLGVLLTRTKATSSEWRFGDRVRNTAQVQLDVDEYIKAKGTTAFANHSIDDGAYVSSLFANYNRMVSSAVTAIVGVVGETRKNLDLNFLARSKLFAYMHSLTTTDYRFRELLHGALRRGCWQMFEAAQVIADPNSTPNQKSMAQLSFQSGAASQQVSNKSAERITLTQPALEYLAGMKVNFPELYNIALNTQSTPVADHLNTIEIHKWFTLNQKQNRDLILDPTKRLDSSSWSQSYNTELQKLGITDVTLRCDQVWNFAYAGLYLYGVQRSSGLIEAGKESGLDPGDFTRTLMLGKGATDPGKISSQAVSEERAAELNVLSRIIALYTLRNELERGNVSSFLNDYTSRGLGIRSMNAPAQSDLAMIEQHRVRSQEFENRTKIITTLTSLPYYQGVGLYLLAILFPFFALLLLIPGKYSGFFQWFFLWFWVKSWDIGIAVVMLLDDILYSIFATAENASGSVTRFELEPNLEGVVTSLRYLDPTFQMSTYYAIIATAMGAIPLVTSYLIMGGMKGGSNVILNGLSHLSDTLGQAGQDALRTRASRYLRSQSQSDAYQQAITYTKNQIQGQSRYIGAYDGWRQRENVSGENRSSTGQSNPYRESAIIDAQARGGLAAGLSHSARVAVPGVQSAIPIVGPLIDEAKKQRFNYIAFDARYEAKKESIRASNEALQRNADLARVVASANYDYFMTLRAQSHSQLRMVYGGFLVPEANTAAPAPEETVGDFAALKADWLNTYAPSIALGSAIKGIQPGGELGAGLSALRNQAKLEKEGAVARLGKAARGAPDAVRKTFGNVRTIGKSTFGPRFNVPDEEYARMNLLSSLIEEVAAEEGLEPEILAGMISRESQGDPNAVGAPNSDGTRDYGLMQINSKAHPDFFKNHDWRDPRENIEYGAHFLREMLDRFDYIKDPELRLRTALAAYNAGPGNAREGYEKGDPDLYTNQHNYSRDVLRRAESYGYVFDEDLQNNPAPGGRISSVPGEDRFSSGGSRRDHVNIDISGRAGLPTVALDDVRVIFAGNNDPEGYGNTVVVELLSDNDRGGKKGDLMRYAHLQGFNVKEGQELTRGEQIGTMGSPGRATGPNLHFEYLRERDGHWYSYDYREVDKGVFKDEHAQRMSNNADSFLDSLSRKR